MQITLRPGVREADVTSTLEAAVLAGVFVCGACATTGSSTTTSFHSRSGEAVELLLVANK
jgi:hypothetical protein